MPLNLVQHAERGVVRVARVDHHGKGEFVSKRELSSEKVALRVFRFGRVVEVEADFAHGGASVRGVECTDGRGEFLVRSCAANLVAVGA